MKNTVKVALTGAAIAAAVGLASPASAVISTVGSPDDMSAVNLTTELQLTGMNQTVWESAQLGPSICSGRAQGWGEDYMIHWYEQVQGRPSEQAVEIVMGAEYHFCHAFEHANEPAGTSPGQNT